MTKHLTADDLRRSTSDEMEEFRNQVDIWLKDKVFPKFKNKNGYEVPNEFSLSDLTIELEERGFTVSSYSSYDVRFVYISI